MRISICIPVYEMHGKGAEFLVRCLNSIRLQTFQDYEIIISDNSDDNEIENLCAEVQDFFKTLRYVKNPIKGMAVNTNNAINQAKGELIKVLYQDDYFASDQVLQEISDHFTEKDSWLIIGSDNNPNPYYSAQNTLGSPSALTFSNTIPLRFNEHLKWVLDLDFYKRMYKELGLPKILSWVGVCIGLGEHQVTNHLTEEQKNEEHTRIKT